MKKHHFLIALAAILGLSAITFSFTYNRYRKPGANPVKLASALPTQDDARRFSDTNRVRASALSSGLRSVLTNLGDRLERAGKERVTYSGTLRRGEEIIAAPFTLTWELPGRIRLEDFGRQQITVFDGETISRTQASSTTFQDELIETLVYDSAEHFLVSQMQGAGTRFLGSRFQLNTSTAERSNSVYDIFEVTEQNKVRPNLEAQTRQYFFNSDTQVLELVRYRLSRNGVEVPVEVRFEGWQRSSDQLFPSRIIRFENGTPLITLSLSVVAIAPRLDDGIFNLTQSQR